MEASSSRRRQIWRRRPMPMRRQMGWKGKTLYICFGGDPHGYAIRSVSQFDYHFLHKETRPLLESSLSELDYPQLTPPPPLREVWHHYDDERGVPVGCVLLDSKVYFVGSAFPKPGSSDANKSLFCFNLADRSITFYSGMSVRYHRPIVFSANNMIFVLSEPNPTDLHKIYKDERYRITDPGPAFEVFNPSTQKWGTLVPPPFFDPQSDYYRTSHQMTGHAVIGGYFCVSTEDVSFKFKVDVDVDDVKKMIWEPCMMFQDHPDPRISSTSRILLTSSTPCGHPFPFQRRAILFGDGDDILISMAFNKLLAYKMDGDRVVKSQSLDVGGVTETCSFSDVGDGLLFIASAGVYFEYGDYSFNVQLLRINKKKEDEEEFLQCEVVNSFFYHFKEEVEMWFPVHCFVR